MVQDYSKIPYRQGANAFIVDQTGTEILIVQKQSYAANQWDVPGGGIDGNETPEQGILRELKEELGLENISITQKSPLINKYEWPPEVIDDYYKNKGLKYRGQEKYQFLFRLDKSVKITAQQEELREVKWVPIAELEKYFVFDGQYQSAIQALKSFGLDL